MMPNSVSRCAAGLALALVLGFGSGGAAPAFAQSAKPAPPVSENRSLTVRGPVMPGPQGPKSLADLVAQLQDAVVNISSSQKVSDGDRVTPPQLPQGSPFKEFFDQFFDGKNGVRPPSEKVDSLGSGFVVDPSGLIVTNNHVIDGADDVEVNFTDGSTRKATVIGIDKKTDLALLKVDGKTQLPFVSFGNSDTARIGDWVLAIGNPFGLGGSVSIGIVSARGRDINSGPYDDFIQTDAAINRGNSGGPLFNMEGRVVGINTAIISPSGGSIGIGFAIPSELAKNVIDQLNTYHEVRRGWLGVRIQPVTDDITESMDLPASRGALVAGVVKGGPVDDGTIKAGDVIISFDGKPVNDMHDLPRIVAESPVGKTVDVAIIRNGKRETVKVTLGLLKDSDAVASAETGGSSSDEGRTAKKQEQDSAALGMTLGALDDAARKTYGIAADVDGVVVTQVDPNSAAAEKRISPGDVIVQVGQEDVTSPQDVIDRIAGLRDDGRRNALMMLADKSGQLRFLTVRMD